MQRTLHFIVGRSKCFDQCGGPYSGDPAGTAPAITERGLMRFTSNASMLVKNTNTGGKLLIGRGHAEIGIVTQGRYSGELAGTERDLMRFASNASVLVKNSNTGE